MGGVLEEVMGRLWLPADLWARPRKWEAPYRLPCPWNMCATCLLCSQRLPQGHKLEMEMWYWDPLDSIHNWSQLRPLYKLLGFRGECVNLFVLRTDPRDKPCKIPLFILTATYWSEVPYHFLPSLSVLCTGAGFRWYLGSSWAGCEQTMRGFHMINEVFLLVFMLLEDILLFDDDKIIYLGLENVCLKFIYAE